ncbi:MAG: hypothetical protein D6741_03045, partial [Planctomycetota bacterium]
MSRQTNNGVRRTFFSRYGVTILTIVSFLIPIMWVGTERSLSSNKNDVKNWLPDRYEETSVFEWYRSHFESDMFILVSWEGCVLGDLRLEEMAARLVPGDDQPVTSETFFKEAITGTQLVDRLVEREGLTRNEAIKRLQGFMVGADGKQTCLVLSVDPEAEARWNRAHPHSRQKFLHKVIDAVYAAAESSGIPREEVHMGGPPVDNVAIDIEGQRSLFRLAGVCGFIGLVMAWWCLRSWKLTFMVFTSGLYSAGLSLVVVWLSGVHMNAILLTMPALVYVAAISGAIHLANYYRDAVRANTQKGLIDPTVGAADQAASKAWLPLFLATGTTAFGLASLSISELVPIKQFGIFSAAGVVVSFVFILTYLPSMLELWPVRHIAEPRGASAIDPGRWSGWRKVGDFVLRRPGWVIAGCLLMMAVGTYGASRVKTSVKLMRFFSPESTIIRDYAWLEEKLGPLVPMEVVIRVDPEKSKLDLLEQMRLVAAVQRSIDQLDDVGSVLAAPTFARDLPNRPGVMERRTWIVQLQRHREDLADYWAQEDGDELWRVSTRLPALTDLDYENYVTDIRRAVEPILAKYRAQGVEGISATYTGLVPLIYKAQHSLLDGLILGFAGDLLLIGVAMIFFMRDWSSGLLLGLASLFPITVVFGAMGLLGIVVDVGTVMTPAVALGVTVDDAIHFMIWCRHGRERGMTRYGSIMFAYEDCARAIYQSWGVIGLGLSAFALSSFSPTQRFGVLMFVMLTASSFGNLVLLPALLASSLGYFFWKGADKVVARQKEKAARRGEQETSEPEM